MLLRNIYSLISNVCCAQVSLLFQVDERLCALSQEHFINRLRVLLYLKEKVRREGIFKITIPSESFD